MQDAYDRIGTNSHRVTKFDRWLKNWIDTAARLSFRH
jgi:hypothetical protein